MAGGWGDPNREYGIPGIDDQVAGSEAQKAAVARYSDNYDEGESDEERAARVRAAQQAAASEGGYNWNGGAAPDLNNPVQRLTAWNYGDPNDPTKRALDYNWMVFNNVKGYQSSNPAIRYDMSVADKAPFGMDYWRGGPATVNASQYDQVPGLRAPSVTTAPNTGAPSVTAQSAGSYVAPGINPNKGGLNWQDYDPNVGMTVQELFEKQYGKDQAYQIWQQQSAANAQAAPSTQPASPAPSGTTSTPAPAGTTQPAATGKKVAVGFDGKPVDVSGMSPEEFAAWQQYNKEMAAETKRQTRFAEQLQLDELAVRRAMADADKAYKEGMLATNNQQLALQAARDAMDGSIRQQGIDLQKKQLALQYRRQAVGAPRITTRA